jgi:CheY-like chemotaxis protein
MWCRTSRSWVRPSPRWVTTCFFAQSGEEALGVIQKEDLDLILLDVMMPGMTGFELSEKDP